MTFKINCLQISYLFKILFIQEYRKEQVVVIIPVKV